MTDKEPSFAVSALHRQQQIAMKQGFYPESKQGLRAQRSKFRGRAGTPGYGSAAREADGTQNESSQSDEPKSVNRGYHGNPALASSKLGTGPSRYDPQPLQVVVGRITNKLGWSSTLSAASIAVRWPEIVGTLVAEHCEVETFNDNVLVVRASSTAWANQMKILLPTLERNIRETLGTNAVKQVIIRGPEAPSWRKGPLHIPGRGPRDTYG
ncbi:MAG: DciA family protein [Actinomycetaceae bacterium]|nr:DciA family protein [Actinomycetaceae bacterium]